jgi:hypothetical protein
VLQDQALVNPCGLTSVRIRTDEALCTAIDKSAKVARYVVPARRQGYIEHAEVKYITSDGNEATYICTEDIIAPQEVKPTFRTPCGSIMVGQIAINLVLS